ncbi:hypothetical protein [Polaromonas sp.]|uniref:hypothetical protein n=1 Tax=Polaromonas sp. TaxID=1869339 RepID=UPI002FC5D2D5
MHQSIFKSFISAGLLASLSLAAALAQAAEPYVNATVGGVLAPGVYGRIDIGTAPPPPVIYTQPVIVTPVPAVVQQAPVYLYVPPGHAKKWSKHCAKYNACGQPVYFVKVDDNRKHHKKKQKHDDRDERHGRHDRDDD